MVRRSRATDEGRGRPPLRLALAAASSVAVLAATAVAAAHIVRAGDLIIDVDTRLTTAKQPQSAKKGRFAAAAFDFRADLRTVSGALPPSPTHFELEFDRRARLTNFGLPSCQPTRLEGASVAAARAACRKAIVGRGGLRVVVAEPGMPVVNTTSQMTAFNGPLAGGGAVLLIHAQIFTPAQTTYVVPVTLTRIPGGRYGIRASGDPPPIAGGHGRITHFKLRLKRGYRFGGARRSVVSVRCGRFDLLARGFGQFSDGTLASGLILMKCRER
jgi:hypothetical protein